MCVLVEQKKENKKKNILKIKNEIFFDE